MRQPRTTELHQFRFGDVRVRFPHDKSPRHFSPLLVRDRNHHGLVHGRVRDQHFLDFERRDVLAAADDDVFLPIDDQHVAIAVDGRQVSGMEPSALHRVQAVSRPLPVAVHDDVAAGHDLPNRLAVAGHFPAVGIDDADLDAGNRIARAGRL